MFRPAFDYPMVASEVTGAPATVDDAAAYVADLIDLQLGRVRRGEAAGPQGIRGKAKPRSHATMVALAGPGSWFDDSISAT